MDNHAGEEFYEKFWADAEYQLKFAFDSAVRDREPAIRRIWSGLAVPERVLDFGCGNGVLTYWLKWNGFGRMLLGVDISKTGVRFATKEFAREGLLYSTTEDANLHECVGAFDVVVSSHVLEHIPDPGAVLSRLRPLAEWFLIEVPLERCWSQSLAWWLRRRPQSDNALGHVNIWNKHLFRQLLNEHRFLVVRDYQYASAPFSPFVGPLKRLLERLLLAVLGVRLYGALMATHYIVLLRKLPLGPN